MAKTNIKIHDSAVVEGGALIGDGTIIWQNCIIQSEVEIGEKCSFGANVFVERGVKIGNGVKVKNNVALYYGLTCEDDVFLGPNCVFTNVINPRSFLDKKQEIRKTVIKKGATIGANATIVCGNVIGRYALIGAGAVVTKNVPDYALVIGNPGKIIGCVCECGCTLDDRLKCPECGKEYKEVSGIIMKKCNEA